MALQNTSSPAWPFSIGNRMIRVWFRWFVRQFLPSWGAEHPKEMRLPVMSQFQATGPEKGETCLIPKGPDNRSAAPL
jgi:hypothetical protein